MHSRIQHCPNGGSVQVRFYACLTLVLGHIPSDARGLQPGFAW